MDWDDLDLLEMMTPAFTRNVQLSLQRPNFSGGYHALKMPWRLKQSSGLAFTSGSRRAFRDSYSKPH